MYDQLPLWLAELFSALDWVLQTGLLAYFIGLNLAYVTMLVIARRQLQKRIRLLKLRTAVTRFYKEDLPISIIAPAYNEEAVIIPSVQAMLSLAYPEFEVIVVCDGPQDQTVALLKEHFQLVPISPVCRKQVSSQPVEEVLICPFEAKLKVVVKKNGGKADALNAGINYAKYPLFCAIDTDSLIEPDALYKLVQPFLTSKRTVASGGTLRLTNGSTFERGVLKHQALPTNWPALFQIIEYLRAFIVGRLGFDAHNAMLIISGAFGLFNKEAVVKIGGYNPKSIGEDMDLIVRLHRYHQDRGLPYAIVQVPEAVCWTEAPETLKALKSQRVRWHRGLYQVLAENKSLFFNRKALNKDRFPVTLSMYFFLFFEFAAPAIEAFGYLYLICAAIFGWLDWEAFAAIFGLALSLSLLVTTWAIYLDERYTGCYATTARGMGKLLLVALLEPFTFRLASLYWRLLGIYRILRNQATSWEAIPRIGFGGSK